MGKVSHKVVSPGNGKNYDLYLNHAFVKVSGKDTDGLYSIIEEKLEPGFRLEPHLHRKHIETFYILEGEVEFTVDGKTFVASTGTVVHVPPNTPHGIKADVPSRLLIICSPGGFERLLDTYTQMTSEQFENPGLLRSLDEQHDLIRLAR